MQKYVVGFLYDFAGRVVLIRKNRPEWQDGKLNGIGGHIEPGETPFAAMVREFQEETGGSVFHWSLFATLLGSNSVVDCFVARTRDIDSLNLESKTDEDVEIHYHKDIQELEAVPNLKWLLPLGIQVDGHYRPVIFDFRN